MTDTVGSSLGVGTHLHIERQWETQMRYLIVVGGRGAPIGGKLPIWMTLMPLAPIRIYRISFILEGASHVLPQTERLDSALQSAWTTMHIEDRSCGTIPYDAGTCFR